MNEVVVGIDIGSSKVCVTIGEFNKKNQLQILGVGTAECRCLKKGIIIDIDNAVEAIKNSINQSERMSGMEISSAFISIAGGHATLIKNRGVIAVSAEDREIAPEDVERVLQVVKMDSVPLDLEVVGVIPLQFIVDGYEHIKDPVGMIGVRLEVEAYLVTVATATVQNLTRVIERCGIKVSGVVIDSLASAEAVLTKDEKELGTAIVDVGGEITDISVYKNGNLQYTKLIPVGGAHITNDISYCLKIPISEAEVLKRQYGYAAVSMLKTIEDISINSIGHGSQRTISNKELVDIIEARIQEIYYLINRELEASGFKGDLAGGVVITGGGISFIKGTLEMADSVMSLPVRIGAPSYIGVASPIYTTAAGIVKYILSSYGSNITIKYNNKADLRNSARPRKGLPDKNDNIIGKIKEFFIDFF